MTEAARKKAAYEDLYSTPENMIGEIISGEIVGQADAFDDSLEAFFCSKLFEHFDGLVVEIL